MNTARMFIALFGLTSSSFCATIDSIDFDTFDFDTHFNIPTQTKVPTAGFSPESHAGASFVTHEAQPDRTRHLASLSSLDGRYQSPAIEHDNKENILSNKNKRKEAQHRQEEPDESSRSTVTIRTKRIKRSRNDSFAHENKAYDIVSRIPMTSGLTLCDQLSKSIPEFTDQYIFPQIPHHLDYVYTMYFMRTGGTPTEFLALMRSNDVNIDIPRSNLSISYARKKPKKMGQKKPLSESDIVGWLGFSLPKNHLI